MTNAAITPGIQPAIVSKHTINTEPHPLSITAKGGKIMDKITRHILISLIFFKFREFKPIFHHNYPPNLVDSFAIFAD